ncbi:MAG TPA: 16S rRNA (cytidine(1402)-2'-O)-methyltransferase [Solirubrobacteraceae bacterium]|nr:16S rRNA (cytidine(1402)-2'-O)-methyltransferase [Solirubrobacteraceae bacterium]
MCADGEAVASDLSPRQQGRLVVCPTPIGNLRDITLRALDALRDAEAIACEDTRRTRILLDHFQIEARLVSLHEHNERRRAGELVKRMQAGETVALVSDAGTPLVSDPGFVLVRECVDAGLEVEVLPGPSSVTTALVASGLTAERWRFVGFMPRKRSESTRLLRAEEDTLIAFEAPSRLAATLELLVELDPDRPAVVCRELTKLHEEIRRGTAVELAAHYKQHPPRGEIVLVVAAGAAGEENFDSALGALRELVAGGAKPRPAAAAVARLTGLRANRLYGELADS